MDVPVRVEAMRANVLLTVKVTGLRTFRLWLWIGLKLLRLAMAVAGVPVRFEEDAGDE